MLAARRFQLCLALAALSSCTCDPARSHGTGTAPSASTSAAAVSSSAAAVPVSMGGTPKPPAHARSAPVREGGALVRSVTGDAVFVADEDHRAVRRIPLPLGEGATLDGGAYGPPPGMVSFTVPGPPAQVLALGDGRLLVTVRDPGLLVILAPDPAAGLVEQARVPLPADAWGVAVTPDEKIALVTSAWTHQVSAVDLLTKTRRWSLDVAREPRGVVVRPDGRGAYVTHLVGSELTRIDDLGGTPTAKRVAFPPAPERAPSGKTLHASLGYTAVLSPDGLRLFAARQALGALGIGLSEATVDVLATSGDLPVLPKHVGGLPEAKMDQGEPARQLHNGTENLTQPRAMVYRRSTQMLLVASEGDDALVELDALSAAPTAGWLRTYPLGRRRDAELEIHFVDGQTEADGRDYGVAGQCAAPTGLALSEQEDLAYVFCRGTYDVVSTPLRDAAGKFPAGAEARYVHVADDPLGGDAALGRRFFYNSSDIIVSRTMGCAGCHPDGRDDGMVWHEADVSGDHVFIGEPESMPEKDGHTPKAAGFPRQTPMLAGRVGSPGPYGWHAQNKDLSSRLVDGFRLHRWGSFDTLGQWDRSITSDVPHAIALRVRYLRAFLAVGLVPPPRDERALSPEEERGRALFLGPTTGCARCHVPDTEYTDRTAYPLPRLPPPPGFEDEPALEFRTPGLRFVGGTPPYFHDGHAATLEALVDGNGDRMGHVSQLSKEERAALVAFLKTL